MELGGLKNSEYNAKHIHGDCLYELITAQLVFITTQLLLDRI
jgi:hypothetical protein